MKSGSFCTGIEFSERISACRTEPGSQSIRPAPRDVFQACARRETRGGRAGGLTRSAKRPGIDVFPTLLLSAGAEFKSNTITDFAGTSARRTIVYRFRTFARVKLTYRALLRVAPDRSFDFFGVRRPRAKCRSVRLAQSHPRCRLRFAGFLGVPKDPESSTASSTVHWVGRTGSSIDSRLKIVDF